MITRPSDEQVDAVRERRDEGAGAEAGDPGEQHLLAAEDVAERAAAQHQRREREHVAVDDPLQARHPGPQRGLHVGERDADDRVVEERQEEDRADGGQSETPGESRMPSGHRPDDTRRRVGSADDRRRRRRQGRLAGRRRRSRRPRPRACGPGRRRSAGRPAPVAPAIGDAEPSVAVAAQPGDGVAARAGRPRPVVGARGCRRPGRCPRSSAASSASAARSRPRPGRRGSRRRAPARSSRTPSG